MRIRVIDALKLLTNRLSHTQVLEEQPDLEPEDTTTSLLVASRRLDHPILTTRSY